MIRHANVPVIWILGGPGCGKGTQCDKIVQKYGFQHYSTGDLLRAEVASGSEKGKALKEIMAKGELVSNDEVLNLLERAMLLRVSQAKGFLIDGYPREKDQGVAFEEQIAPADLIIYFECTPDTMVQRVLARAAKSKEVRADDNEETIKTRINTFLANTDLILEQYPEKTKRINAERSVDDIFLEVVEAIDETIAIKENAKTASSVSA